MESYHGVSRMAWMALMGFVLIWVDAIKLPRFLAHPVNLISQATFYIFLLHFMCFSLVIHPGEWLGLGPLARNPWLLMVAGLTIPVLIWAGFRAMTITWRRMQRSPALKIS